MDYIRRTYGVPAKVGGKVMFEGRPGVIVGSHGPYLKIRIDGHVRNYHPTWHLVYLPQTKKAES